MFRTNVKYARAGNVVPQTPNRLFLRVILNYRNISSPSDDDRWAGYSFRQLIYRHATRPQFENSNYATTVRVDVTLMT